VERGTHESLYAARAATMISTRGSTASTPTCSWRPARGGKEPESGEQPRIAAGAGAAPPTAASLRAAGSRNGVNSPGPRATECGYQIV